MTISNVSSSNPAQSSSPTQPFKNDKQIAAKQQDSVVVNISNEARKLNSEKNSLYTATAPKPAPQNQAPAPNQADTHEQPAEARNTERVASAPTQPAPQTKTPAPEQVHKSDEANNSERLAAASNSKAQAPQTSQAPEAPGIKFMTGESKSGHINTYA